MIKKIFWFTGLILLFACSTDYSEEKHPKTGRYVNKTLNEEIVIIDTAQYVHIYNNNRNKDTGTYEFYPGIKEVNFWGELRLKKFKNTNPEYNKCRVHDLDSSIVYSFQYSFESFYTNYPVIVFDIDEVKQGFDFSK